MSSQFNGGDEGIMEIRRNEERTPVISLIRKPFGRMPTEDELVEAQRNAESNGKEIRAAIEGALRDQLAGRKPRHQASPGRPNEHKPLAQRLREDIAEGGKTKDGTVITGKTNRTKLTDHYGVSLRTLHRALAL